MKLVSLHECGRGRNGILCPPELQRRQTLTAAMLK